MLVIHQAKSESIVSADYEESGWEDNNPSVFKMTILTDKTIQGEYQITNGYGPDRAPNIMRVRFFKFSLNFS